MYFETKEFLKHISIDSVVFGFHENQLKVLLLRMKKTNEWALPGGFVKKQETLEKAASRVLKERTGLNDIFLKQFSVFSDPNRSRKNPAAKELSDPGSNSSFAWFSNRFISVGYYALVNFSQVEPTPDFFSDRCEWQSIDEIDRLIIDHNQIINKALETLRLQLNYQPIGYNLLPPKFTMPQLQKLYETLLGKTLDRRNFQRKILSYKILNKLDERKTGGAHKAPYLYEFNLENYQKALQNGLYGGW
ncbi:NUDIX hydrolase [Sunxiuqinia indica]|uniref:NUDIX hydrolase n=1 Tax=Sunxiuqinia indica TaxID=2692584 RepID=UPI0013581635|nr:NUDIX domain-containing protein [Sunxiuqinia indica]